MASLGQIRKELQKLKKRIQPSFIRVFVFFANGKTADGNTEKEIDAFIAANPNIQVLKLFRLSCRKTEE